MSATNSQAAFFNVYSSLADKLEAYSKQKKQQQKTSQNQHTTETKSILFDN